MNLLQLQSQFDQTTKLIESSYQLLSDTPTNSDIESAVKNKMLIRIKNLLVESVIVLDLVDELNTNPGDISTLEAILDLISDTVETLS